MLAAEKLRATTQEGRVLLLAEQDRNRIIVDQGTRA